MKIEFGNDYKKGYCEITPTVAYSWYYKKTLFIGWIFWSVIITF